jgi:pimeloyl-ACP methyl ester carboxylesterase
MPSWWRRVEAVQTPSLLLASKNDGAITERAGLLSGALANSRTVSIGDGHHLHTQHLDAFLAEVLPFLAAGLPSLTESNRRREPADICS